MTLLVDEPDDVVTVAWEILQDEATEGTKNIRRGSEGDTEFVYRLDPDADGGEDVDPENVRDDGEFPEADVVMWRAERGAVEDEVDRRGLAGHPEPGEVDTRDSGNRQR